MAGDWTPLFALALVSQVLVHGPMIYALGKLSPLVVGTALLVQPVVAGAMGWIVYGERLGLPDLAGVVMVAKALVPVRRGSTTAPKSARSSGGATGAAHADREALRRALAVLAQPQDLARGAKRGWRTVDLTRRRADDVSVDHKTR